MSVMARAERSSVVRRMTCVGRFGCKPSSMRGAYHRLRRTVTAEPSRERGGGLAGVLADETRLNAPGAAAADHDGGPDRHAVVEIVDVLVEHAHAARGDGLADAPRLVDTVDAEQDVAVVLVEVEGTRAERIVDAALHGARQVRLEADHGRGRAPVRPSALASDGGGAAPGEALAA